MVDRKPNVFVKGHRFGISVDTYVFVITQWSYGSGTVADLSPSMEWPSFRRR